MKYIYTRRADAQAQLGRKEKQKKCDNCKNKLIFVIQTLTVTALTAGPSAVSRHNFLKF